MFIYLDMKPIGLMKVTLNETNISVEIPSIASLLDNVYCWWGPFRQVEAPVWGGASPSPLLRL